VIRQEGYFGEWIPREWIKYGDKSSKPSIVPTQVHNNSYLINNVTGAEWLATMSKSSLEISRDGFQRVSNPMYTVIYLNEYFSNLPCPMSNTDITLIIMVVFNYINFLIFIDSDISMSVSYSIFIFVVNRFPKVVFSTVLTLFCMTAVQSEMYDQNCFK
jgi:hypothetical protein